MDRISHLPDGPTDLILKKLSLRDRVKTSVLSKSWRKRWTSLSSLKFDRSFKRYIRYSEGYMSKYSNIIDSILRKSNGGIKDFHLYIPELVGVEPDFSLFEPAIQCVSKNSSILEKLFLETDTRCVFDFPYAFFSAVNLSVLEISQYQFQVPVWFEGFPSLKYFRLGTVNTSIDMLSHFVSICPQLEKVVMRDVYFPHGDLSQILDLKAPKLTNLWINGVIAIPVSVSNAQSLKTVYIGSSFSKMRADDRTAAVLSPFMNAVDVTLGLCYSQFLGRCKIIHMLPKLRRLKRLIFADVFLRNQDELQCFLGFCASSPNVRTLQILLHVLAQDKDLGPPDLVSVIEKNMNHDFGHLVRVDVIGITGTEIEMKIIEKLLRLSPVLEVMNISIDVIYVQQFRDLQETVTEYYKASTKAKILFCYEPSPYSRGACRRTDKKLLHEIPAVED